jgi:coenzyme F420-reducing hydrogenase beta subunit
MEEDDEGFLYPKVNESLCIKCNICNKLCPIENNDGEIKKNQVSFLLQHKNRKIRDESTSGGAFTAFATWIIKNGGVVFGAAFDGKLKVKHCSVDNIEDLSKFRNSKYVQSEIGLTFKEAKTYLDLGRWVCFSGTPCEIEGFVKFLKKKYEKLLLVDVVCRAVPSPLVFRKYMEMKKEQLGGSFKSVLFRDKYYGYKYSTFSIYNEDTSKDYHSGIESNFYLRAFFSNISPRPSCFSCPFKKRYRISDFTIWDCFNVDRFNKKMDDDIGTTRVLVHSEKGRKILHEIENQINLYEIPVSEAINGVREMIEVVPCNSKRSDFFNDLNKLDTFKCFNKYFPITNKVKIERSLRLLCFNLGIYKFIKKTYKLFFRNKNNQRR